ncbi:hypothetical protein HDU96_003870 [Phlyctochytrium bullatum]|nr:hypothetical protein HDU96_003870 [Phlyctochytrium bullatum]
MGHGCNVPGSFNDVACFSARANSSTKTQCVSGFYDFSDSTWVIPERIWDGTSEMADWTYQGNPDSLLFGTGSNGRGISLVLLPLRDKMPKTGSGPYTRSNISDATDQYGGDLVMTSTTYLNYGRFTARIRAGEGNGVVTSLISMSDDKDEIDWEFTRGDSRAESNTFSKGVFNSKVQVHEVGNATSANFHIYGITWLPDRIEWYIDDVLVRTYREGQGEFPRSRSAVQISIWNGGDSQNGGTSGWAGGPIDWERPNRENRLINATFDWVMIECLDDLNKPRPTAPPRRGATLTKPPFNPPTTTLTTVTATTVMVTVNSVVSVTDSTGGVTLSTEQVTKPVEAAKATSGAFGLGSAVVERWSLTTATVVSSLLMVLALDL